MVEQGPALHVLHDDEGVRAFLPDVVYRGDVGVVERGEGARLQQEALLGHFVGEVLLRQELDRDHPAEVDVQGLVDGALPAPPQRLQDLVARNQRPPCQLHGRDCSISAPFVLVHEDDVPVTVNVVIVLFIVIVIVIGSGSSRKARRDAEAQRQPERRCPCPQIQLAELRHRPAQSRRLAWAPATPVTPRHDFSKAQARQPEACGKCHLGPDHPQKEIYEEYKHGNTYFTNIERDEPRRLTRWVVGEDYSAAPTCATCHLAATGRAAGHPRRRPAHRLDPAPAGVGGTRKTGGRAARGHEERLRRLPRDRSSSMAISTSTTPRCGSTTRSSPSRPPSQAMEPQRC